MRRAPIRWPLIVACSLPVIGIAWGIFYFTGPYTQRSSEQAPLAWSALGEPLYAPPLTAEVREAFESKLASARESVASRPEKVESWIWLGRRTAYLGRFREAVEIYDEALRRFPEDPRLYRHRGHRMITLRRLPDAVRDLELASRLMAGLPNRVEPDGLPNAAGIPTTTLQGNVWYHLGLSYYLLGDWKESARCYEQALAVADNADSTVAASYWLWLSRKRLGRDEQARELLEPIHAELELLENHDYLHLLLLFKGEADPDALLESSVGSPLRVATVGYGVAGWHHAAGRRDRARSILHDVIRDGSWPAFGRAAAENDLPRFLVE